MNFPFHIFWINKYFHYNTIQKRNSYFLHWNFDWKSCFVVFFHEWNEWKNPQINFSSQDLSIERNFLKWDDEKGTKISHLLFHRIWKNTFLKSRTIEWRVRVKNVTYVRNMVKNSMGFFCNYYNWCTKSVEDRETRKII